MNQYFKFQSDSDLGVGTQYIEFNDTGWATRQAECYGDRWFNSNKTYHKELGSMSLCDQQLTIAGMELGVKIDAKEFELVWNLSNEDIQKISENISSDRLIEIKSLIRKQATRSKESPR